MYMGCCVCVRALDTKRSKRVYNKVANMLLELVGARSYM